MGQTFRQVRELCEKIWSGTELRKGSVLPLDIRLQKVERVVTEEDGDKLITGIHHNYLSIPNVAPS